MRLFVKHENIYFCWLCGELCRARVGGGGGGISFTETAAKTTSPQWQRNCGLQIMSASDKQSQVNTILR